MVSQIRTGIPLVRIRSLWCKASLVSWISLWMFAASVSAGSSYTFHVQEEQPPGTYVGKVDGASAFEGSPKQFGFNSNTGVISTTARIDRETTTQISLQLRTLNPSNQPISVQVQVDDINDNEPRFPTLYYTLRIRESMDVNTTNPINTATDPDAGNNGTVDYTIASGDNTATFSLGTTACPTGSTLCVITKKPLDRETTDFYQLNITATDRGTPALMGYCLINITILDENDHAPVFTQNSYLGSIAENTKPGVSILRVSAADRDSGSNGDIKYAIDWDAIQSNSIFDLDSSTGVIRTKQNLDFEVKNSYTFNVIASDGGVPSKNDLATVTINVLDTNDNSPQLKITYLPPHNGDKAIRSENSLINTNIAYILVTDKDSNTNSQTELKITNGDDEGCFKVEFLGFYFIQLQKPLDRELVPFYNLTLNVTDKGVPSRSTLGFVLIDVTDVNDNSPAFTSNAYTANISELAQNGSYVLQLNATDPDEGDNGTVSYSITGGNDLGWFQVDFQSGLVTTAKPLDREQVSSVTITITAQDHGSAPKTGSTTVTVTIIDGNDNKPRFMKSSYKGTISEGASIGATVLQVSATDVDSGDNGRITYEISSSDAQVNGLFELNTQTGVLWTKSQLDRETKSLYSFTVLAKDHGDPQLMSSVKVELTISDINDNAPVFYPVEYFASIMENEPPGKLLQVTATDADEGTNAVISYDIIGGNNNGNFSIDSSTGVISTLASLDHEVEEFFSLIISAKDGGNKYAAKTAVVNVTVLNKADNLPVFLYEMYNFTVYENVPKGTLVGRVYATTKDKNGSISYAIVSGDPTNLFLVDSTGGIIKINGDMDREEKAQYLLAVIARVGTVKPLSAQATVNIEVLDRNDNAPQFSTSSVIVDIDGTWLVGQVVYNAAAVDLDAGKNGLVRYQLTSNAEGLLWINSTSGVIKLARKLTDGDETQYTVQVLASDSGSPPQHSTMTIHITLSINHPPKFTLSSYVTHVLASQPLSYQFFYVVAVDQDSGKNGQLFYSIPQGNEEGLFGIFPGGKLYIRKSLLQALKGSYDLIVRATDGGVPSFSASVPVTIYIQDSNDHRSLFVNNTFRFAVAENSSPGTLVGTLVAHALDHSRTKDIVYSLISSESHFAVDVRSGQITTRVRLDREELIKNTGSNVYIMQAEAMYNDTTIKRDKAIVIVTVTDLNDNAPVFSRAVYAITVSELSLPGSPVFRIKAMDADEGDNAKFFYSLVSGTGMDKFFINSSTGELHLSKTLDRETTSSYNLVVKATDASNANLYSTAKIEITVGDSNDQRPVFPESDYTVNITEDALIGSLVINLNASDKDIGQNGLIKYSISNGNLAAMFDVESATGRLIVAKSLDFETTQLYELTITAQDHGLIPLSSTVNVTVNVLDVNDNAPLFPTQPVTLTVRENVNTGFPVGRCTASDRDTGTNAHIAFSMYSQTPSKTFSVNSATCEITTIAAIDLETMPAGRDSFQLVVMATDQGSPKLSTRKSITVQVTDENDNSPGFVSPPAAAAGSSLNVMTITAEDPDRNSNGKVTYSIISGNNGYFNLHPSTGQLQMIHQIPDNPTIYQLTIQASDGGQPSRQTQTVVSVFKEGPIGGGPTFSSADYQGSVTENKVAGTSVVTVLAAYPQSSLNGNIEYYLTSDSSKGGFEVVKSTGVVKTTRGIDREGMGASFNLVVYAVDKQGPSARTSSATVTITVQDVNDNAPVFTSDEFTVSIAENVDDGTTVITVTATDPDAGDNAKVSYATYGGSHGNKFAIDASSGRIYTTGTFDRETKDDYSINVTASDHGNPSKSSTCVVLVTVADNNDNSPKFPALHYVFDIAEDAAVGASIGTVSASDADIGENARLTYSIVSPEKATFSMNPVTGEITVGQRLDREGVEHYLLNVTATDNGRLNTNDASVDVYINVLDVNDNAPQFEAAVYHGEISESADKLTPIVTVKAIDKDSGSNGIVKYSLISGNDGDAFTILGNGTIVNAEVLDREKKSTYNLEVRAVDQATSGGLEGVTRVVINVTDVNDQPPEFTSASVAHVSENSRVGDVVLTVIAVDADEGSNGDVVYSLGLDIGAPFSLGSKDGVLRVSGSMDREKKANYSIRVTATDLGTPPLSASMEITVIVDDYNDHRPVFLSHIGTVFIDENASPGTEIITLQAVDGDSGVNAEIRYAFVTGNSNNSFTINSITGRLRTARNLDRETTPRFTLEVLAYDLGVPRKDSVTNVTVVLRDVNDNQPVFTMSEYAAEVSEGVVESNIVTVVAEDRDIGSDGSVTYCITQGREGGLFVINENTGTIGITAKLDRETKSKYTLRVQATDGGSPALSSEADVIVNVLDQNDHAPVFTPATLTVKVQEDTGSGTTVIKVSAVDGDVGSNADVTYSLKYSFSRFSIDSKTGVITTVRPLDREIAGQHKLEVLASDAGKPPLQGKLDLDIIVRDKNDHDPEFQQSQFQATISQSAPVGTIVFVLSARDEDTGENAESDYSITSGNDASVFSLNARSGVISVSRTVPSSPAQYSLKIKAANRNAPGRTDSATLQITVSSAVFPRFLHPDQSISISELTRVGMEILTVNATGHTTFDIAGGNHGDAFDVDAVQGVVKVKTPLDYERYPNYTLIIGAYDGSVPPHVGYARVVITLQDENDNVPVFSQRVYTAHVPEGKSAGVSVLTVLASDEDSGVNAEVEYHLVGSGPFQVSRTTGLVTTSDVLDRELVGSYTLKVRAENPGNRSMASEAIVHVTVTDINDTPPTLQQPLTASVSEQAQAGDLVLQLHGDDKDEPVNSPLHYGFLPNGNPGGVFAIGAISGNITLVKNLDRETKSLYSLEVFVNDSLHVTQATVNVTVTDINDNPPKFLLLPYVTQLPEDSAVGLTVMNVTAVDADEGTNAELNYEFLLSPYGSFFAVDARTGMITLNRAIAFKPFSALPNPNIYNLTVRARNIYPPHYKADAAIQIEVLDTNDHAPVFIKSVYLLFAVQDAGSGVSIGRVEAVDKFDYGPNALVRYEAISGNGTGRFRVAPETGEVLIASSLRDDVNKTYYIRVRASDMGQPKMSDTAGVYVEVTERNLHPPVFSKAVYQTSENEDIAVGSALLTVTATDRDFGRNGEISYDIIAGNSQEYFGIGLTNGSLYVSKPLDYEHQENYSLNVSATDGGKEPKTSYATVRITLRDVNDNNPVFSPIEYRCELAENTTPRSVVVCSVRATDRDERGQQSVRYSILGGSGKDKFVIDERTGEIRATVEFDFEVTMSSFLMIAAKDEGLSPQTTADPPASVHILITGVNEFLPVFVQSVFTATVAENAPIGHSVLRVSATDKDKGPDGVVLYHLLGSDNQQGFDLDSNTGTLSVSGDLDNERAGIVTLRVIAKNLFQNSVTPSSVAHATIVVTVTDANDPPRFLKSVYSAHVTEGSRIGHVVTNVTAVDDDSDIRSIRYGISAGNTGNAFVMDAVTGFVRTAAELDREAIAEYRLTVTATDNGTPPMTGNATLVVTLDDINDNPPHLTPLPCIGRVTENKPQGTQVMTLNAEDPDLNPNRGPFKYSISGSDYGSFRLNVSSGVVSTVKSLDREKQDAYNISIKVTDARGLSAVNFCMIHVEDQNDNRPKATSRDVYVHTFEGKFLGGVVADVRPDDPDIDDLMTCALLNPPQNNIFSFPRGNCELSSLAYSQDARFDLSVNGSDGLGAVTYLVTLRFLGYTETTLQQGVVVRLRNTNTRDFLANSYHKFTSAVNATLPSGYSSQIMSVDSSGEGLVDVLVSVRQGGTLMIRDRVSGHLKDKLVSSSALDIAAVDYNPCTTGNQCLNGGECSSAIQASRRGHVVSSTPVVMVTAGYTWKITCSCKPGFTGSQCEESVNDCNPNPCRNEGTCTDNNGSFKCSCIPGYTGRLCESDIDECLTNPCKHASACDNTPGGYTCTCKPGYTGQNCDVDINYCQSSPCMYNSTCKDLPTSFECVCDFGGRGERCEISSFGFEPASYMLFPTLQGVNQKTYNNITMEFSTSSPNGLLFYNTDGTPAAAADFIALEIVERYLWFSYNLGYTGIPEVIKSDRAVTDGKWHHVTVIRDKKKGELLVDGSNKKTGEVDGGFTQLELNQSPLLVGGIKDFDAYLSDSRKHVRTHDFVGCIRDLYVDGAHLQMHEAREKEGVMNRCPRKSWCTVSPCDNGGTCVDTWLDYYCECPDGFSGRNCDKAMEAFRFSSTSYLVLTFKESYRRSEKLNKRQPVSARKRRAVDSVLTDYVRLRHASRRQVSVGRERRAVSSDREEFSIRFRTRQNGLLLLAQDSSADYTIVQIASGKVTYSFRAGEASQTLTVTTLDVTNGNWQNVTLERDARTIRLATGTEFTQREFAVTPHNFLGANIRQWSLGGATQVPSGVTLEKFKGCMEDLKINGVNTPMNGPNRFLSAEARGGAVTEGCVTSGQCQSSPCANNKEKTACYEDWDSYTCVSAAPCQPDPCKNNATCKPQKDETFLCVCVGNYTGALCSIPLACQLNPCGEGYDCLGDGAGGRVCVTAGRRASADNSTNVGIIAAGVFLAVVIIALLVGVVAVRRQRRLKKQSDYDANHCEDICPPTDLQDASQRTSPSHSSDDSGVVIRNPSQKSMHLHSSTDESKNIVIHNVGAPEDYQIKLTKSDERIDHGFSESDVGEFIIRNDFASKHSSRDRINHASREHINHGSRDRLNQHSNHGSRDRINRGSRDHINHGSRDHINHGSRDHINHGSRDQINHGSSEQLHQVIKQSTPIEQNYRAPAPRRPRTRTPRNAPGSLARQVLDRRQFGPHRSDPRNRGPSHLHPHRKWRTNSMDTTSSEEPQDFSDTWPRSDIDNNSERLDYYDIEVASIGQSEASYQYEPSNFKDSMLRREMPGLSPAEIERIRQQSRNPPSGSFLDAVSTSSEDAPTMDDKLSSLMERADSSSESSDDTFTCSEFDFDEKPTSKAEEVEQHGTPHGSMVFNKLTNPPHVGTPQHGSHNTLNLSEDELVIANRFTQRPVNGTSDAFNWDDVLNWGLRYHNLRGVYKDIAELPDEEGEEPVNEEEYV